jgi:hypothetical protein
MDNTYSVTDLIEKLLLVGLNDRAYNTARRISRIIMDDILDYGETMELVSEYKSMQLLKEKSLWATKERGSPDVPQNKWHELNMCI